MPYKLLCCYYVADDLRDRAEHLADNPDCDDVGERILPNSEVPTA